MRNQQQRQGSTMLIVMVLLSTVILIAMGSLQQLSIQTDSVHSKTAEIQAESFIQAGLNLATHKLNNSPEYQGETWVVAADQLKTNQAATVTITILADQQQSNLKTIKVQTIYKINETQTTTTRSFIRELPTMGEES